jgi:hypothetical protein
LSRTSIKYGNIIVYVILALLLSYLIRHKFQVHQFKFGFLQDNNYLFGGISTLIAGCVGIFLHKELSKKITVFGNTAFKNTLILCLPIVAFSIIGIENHYGVNESMFGFAYALINTIYAFTEEFGWRKYLQNALEGLNRNVKYIFIGVIWWIWHFRFDSQFDLFIFPLICIGGGFLLGKLADDLESILPVVSMHTLIILTTNSGNFGKNEIIGIGIVIFGWVFIEQIWKRRKAYNTSYDDNAP